MRQNPTLDLRSLRNIDTVSVSDVEAALIQLYLDIVSTCLNVSKSYVETSDASGKYGFVNR